MKGNPMARMQDNTIVFMDGKGWTPKGGVVGLSPEHQICTGYDDVLDENNPETNFTNQQKQELVVLMIQRWMEYGKNLMTQNGEGQPS